jgi:putative salt-induced outer membrane protein YdiY
MRSTVCLVLLLCAVGHGVAADQVFLANGDRLSGKVKIDGDTVTVSSEILGSLKVPRNAVATIKFDQPTSVFVGKKVVAATSIGFARGTASVDVRGGKVLSAPAGAISSSALLAKINNTRTGKKVPAWSGSFEAGFTTARGNTSINNLHFGVIAVQTTDRHRLRLAFTSLLAESSALGKQVTSAGVIHSGARYEFNVSERTFAFGLVNFDSDQQQRLDLRSVAGGGLGRRLADASAATLDVFTGATFNREVFSSFPDRMSGEFLGGQELTYRFSSRTSVNERLVLFPNFTSPGNFRLTFDSSALIKFNNWLGWESRVSEMYLTNPVNVARNNDVIVTTGIRLSYGGEERKFKPRSKIAPFTN